MYELEDLPENCPWSNFAVNGGYDANNTDNCKVNYKNACSCKQLGASKGCGWKSHQRYQDVLSSAFLNSRILNLTNESAGFAEDFKTLGECRWGGQTHGSELDDAMGFFGHLFDYSPGTDGFTDQSVKDLCQSDTICGSLTTPCECFEHASIGCGWSSADFRNPGDFFSEQGSRKEWRLMGRCRNGSTTTGYDVALENFIQNVSTAPVCLGEDNNKVGIDCNDYSSNIAPNICVDVLPGGQDWVDYNGNNCSWYASDTVRCSNPEFTLFNDTDLGFSNPSAGIPASTACCACGGGQNAISGRCNCWENAVIKKGARCGWSSASQTCSYTSRFSQAEIAGCKNQSAWSYDHIDEFDLLSQSDASTAEHVAQRNRSYILTEYGVYDTCFSTTNTPDSMNVPHTKCECLALRASNGCGWVTKPDMYVGIEVTRGTKISDISRDKVDVNEGFCSSSGAWDADLGAQEAWKCLISPVMANSPLVIGYPDVYLYEDANFGIARSSKVPYNASVRGMCDPFDNITRACECFNHSNSFGSLDLARAAEFDAYWGDVDTHFQDLWINMYDFVAPFEGWPGTRDPSATPFYERSCWILYDAFGVALTDSSGAFVPNPNSLGKRCRPERFCGWSDEYISYANATASPYGVASHNDTHGCFAGFQFTLEQQEQCPPPPPPPPPFEPYATPKSNCSSIFDEAECWLYTLVDADFAPYNLGCAWNYTTDQCEVSSDNSITPLFRQLEEQSNRDYLTVTGAYTFDLTESGNTTTITRTGAGGYAYNGLEGYNYTGTRSQLYNTPHNRSYAIQLARQSTQFWRPHVMTLQYTREKRVPFVEKDTCFIIGDLIEPFVEQSYISANPFTDGNSSDFEELTINRCGLVAGKCTVDGPSLGFDFTQVPDLTEYYFRGWDVNIPNEIENRYKYFTVSSSVRQCTLNNAECGVKRNDIVNLTSATRAPPTPDLIVGGFSYTHTILGDEEGKPYLYWPCVNETTKYIEYVNEYASGMIDDFDDNEVGNQYFRLREQATP